MESKWTIFHSHVTTTTKGYCSFSTTLGMMGWGDKHTVLFMDGLKTTKKRMSYEHVEQKQGKDHEKNRLRWQELVPPSPARCVHRCHVFFLGFCSRALRRRHMSKVQGLVFCRSEVWSFEGHGMTWNIMELWVWSPRQFPCQNGQVKFCWHSVQFLCWKHELKTG